MPFGCSNKTLIPILESPSFGGHGLSWLEGCLLPSHHRVRQDHLGEAGERVDCNKSKVNASVMSTDLKFTPGIFP